MILYNNKHYKAKPELKHAECEGCIFYNKQSQSECIKFISQIPTDNHIVCNDIIWEQISILTILKSL